MGMSDTERTNIKTIGITKVFRQERYLPYKGHGRTNE